MRFAPSLMVALALGASACLDFEGAYDDYSANGSSDGGSESFQAPSNETLQPAESAPTCAAGLCLVSHTIVPNVWKSRLWAASKDSVWMVGRSFDTSESRAFHWDGVSWTQVPTPSGQPLNGISGVSDLDLVIAGDEGKVHRWNGSQWSLAGTSEGSPRPKLNAISLTDEQGWAVGERGVILAQEPDKTWSQRIAVGTAVLNDIHARGELAVAVGQVALMSSRSYLVEYLAGSWNILDLGVESQLTRVWLADDQNGFAIGSPTVVLRRGPNGWVQEPLPLEVPLEAVWGTGLDDVWIGGWARTLIHHDGSGWAPVDLREIAPFAAVDDIVGAGKTDLWLLWEDGENTRDAHVFHFARQP